MNASISFNYRTDPAPFVECHKLRPDPHDQVILLEVVDEQDGNGLRVFGTVEQLAALAVRIAVVISKVAADLAPDVPWLSDEANGAGSSPEPVQR